MTALGLNHQYCSSQTDHSDPEQDCCCFSSVENTRSELICGSVCTKHAHTCINISVCANAHMHSSFTMPSLLSMLCALSVRPCVNKHPVWTHCLLKSSKDLQIWPFSLPPEFWGLPNQLVDKVCSYVASQTLVVSRCWSSKSVIHPFKPEMINH